MSEIVLMVQPGKLRPGNMEDSVEELIRRVSSAIEYKLAKFCQTSVCACVSLDPHVQLSSLVIF